MCLYACTRARVHTQTVQLLSVNVQLEQAASDKQSAQQSVRNLSDKLSVLEQRNTTLSGRITSLENEIREIATKVVSSGGASSGGGSAPSTEPNN